MPHTPSGGGCIDAADIALAFADDVDEGLAVEAQRHRPPHLRVVEGRHVAVDDQVAADIGRDQLADRLRRLALDVAAAAGSTCRTAKVMSNLPATKARIARREVA